MYQIASCHPKLNHTDLAETRIIFSFLKLKNKDIKAFNKDFRSIQVSENVHLFLLSSEVEPPKPTASITFTSVDSPSLPKTYTVIFCEGISAEGI